MNSGRSSSTNSLNQQQQQQEKSSPGSASKQRHSDADSSGQNSPAGSSTNNDTTLKARLCHLKKWSHFQGYGFNLHAERSRLGQHIGKVDPNSPAESAGLREGDRIIEVNYVNISNENHQQVRIETIIIIIFWREKNLSLFEDRIQERNKVKEEKRKLSFLLTINHYSTYEPPVVYDFDPG